MASRERLPRSTRFRTIDGWQDAAGLIQPNSAAPPTRRFGVSDIAIGVIPIASFWRSLEFNAGIVGYITLFYIGIAISHVRQAILTGDIASNNFGLLLVITVATLIMLPILYWLTGKHHSAP